MYCIIPLVLGFVAGRSCGYGGYGYGRSCCRPGRCLIVNCRDRRY